MKMLMWRALTCCVPSVTLLPLCRDGRPSVTASFIALCVTYIPLSIYVCLDGWVTDWKRCSHISLLMLTLLVVWLLKDLLLGTILPFVVPILAFRLPASPSGRPASLTPLRRRRWCLLIFPFGIVAFLASRSGGLCFRTSLL